MHKLKLTYILIFFSGFIYAQPDILTRDKSLDYVLIYRDCLVCNPIEKNVPVEKDYFDKYGFHIKKDYLDSLMKPDGRTIYDYKNDKIYSIEYYTTYTSNPPDFNDSYWDSTKIAQKVVYEYKANRLKKVNWFHDNRLDFVIVFEYNKSNQVIKEIETEYSYPNVFKFQAFKPNSAEFMNSIKMYGNSTRIKNYDYHASTCMITYSVNSKQTGFESLTFDDKNKISSRIITNTQNDTLLSEKLIYDNKGRLVEKHLHETGYTAFGRIYDYLGYNKIIYVYDSDNRLIKEEKYYKNRLSIIEKYKYFKK